MNIDGEEVDMNDKRLKKSGFEMSLEGEQKWPPSVGRVGKIDTKFTVEECVKMRIEFGKIEDI
jgi:hypothetical protein